jgi:hypothetical protein
VSLHDEHLRTALRHAPDQDLAPSQSVRENVLAYAANAVKPTPAHWLKRSLNAFANWQVKTWQVAGMGTLASVLFVIVMVREQMPEEPVWAETDNKNLAQAEVAQSKAEMPATNAPEAYQEAPQVAERAAPIREEAKAKRSLATQQESVKDLAETTQLAATPELLKTPDMADAVEANQIPEEAVVATAPIPAPVEAGAKQSLSKARQATASEANEAQILEVLNIEALLKQGGEAIAKQDIASGNLWFLKIETEACENHSKLEAHDDVTNYKVLVICNSDDKVRSDLLQREVGDYNQTMRNWFQKNHK